MRLQGKLLLLLIPLVGGALVAIGSVAYLQLRGNAERNYLQQMDTLLDQLSQQVQSKIRTAEANLELLAANYLVEKYALVADEAERYRLLQRPLLRSFAGYQNVYPDYYEIRYLLPDGYEAARRVLGEVPNRTETEAQNPFFRNLAAVEDAVRSELGVNSDNGEVALFVGKPLRLRDPSVDPVLAKPLLRGYLVITVSLSQLEQQLLSRPLGDTGILFVADAAGEILLHGHVHDDAAAALEPDHSHVLTAADLRALRGGVERPGRAWLDLLDGPVYLQGRELSPQLYLYGALPVDTVKAATEQLGELVIAITLSTIVAVAGVLFFALRRLVLRPLQRLEAVAHQIGRGRLDIAIASSGSDEMASLGQSLAGMAESLARSNERVRFLADHDSLTGLPNRRLFQDYLGKALARARRHGETLVLLFLDIDEFKNVNDTLGHQAGDVLLEQFAERLLGVLREEDMVAHNRRVPGEMVARLGGDEFIVLLPGLAAPATAAGIAERILGRLREPFVINRQRFFVGASIGITVYPDDGDSVPDLVKHADLAMYHAKRSGKNNYQFFAPEMNAAVVRRMHMERRLRQALERQEFVLHFQPVIELRSGRILGAEALVRWQDLDTGRLVPPDEFIPLAEATGLILPLGEWVLLQACTLAKGWQDRGLPRLQVGVNASALQVERGELSQKVREVLALTGLAAEWLELELTETVIMAAAAEVQAELTRLQALGCSIALDDFGVGYSSLNYLRHFSIDKLKIDRSFVRDCAGVTSQGGIVTAIIALAHAFGHKVVGEGVETEGELAFLQAQGCDLGQGFLFSRPLPAAEFEALLEQQAVATRLQACASPA